MGFLYYSTQTALADRIARRYYGGCFFVYCADEFASSTQPGASSPASLYQLYSTIVEEDDRGNAKIKQHKDALKDVALKKLRQNEINQIQYEALVWEVNHAETRDFVPILYLILKSATKKKGRRATPVPVHLRANPNSEEYTIEGLTEHDFETIKAKIRLTW